MRKSLIALAALAVLVASCGDDDAATTGGPSIEQTRPVTISGAALLPLPEAGVDPAIGMAMPELEGASFDGTPVSVTNDGRPKVLFFLAHW